MRTQAILVVIPLLSLLAASVGCSRFEASSMSVLPTVNETGDESAQKPAREREVLPETLPSQPPSADAESARGAPEPALPETDIPTPPSPLTRPPAKDAAVLLKLQQVTNLRVEKDGIMEFRQDLPEGSIIQVTPPYQIKTNDYRTSDGKTERSSTGFIGPVVILSVPDKSLDPAAMKALNESPGGLFVIGSVINANQPTDGDFAALTASENGEAFLNHFNLSGRPKIGYGRSLEKQFGADRINSTQGKKIPTPQDLERSRAVLSELAKAADRTKPTSKSHLLMDRSRAQLLSQAYEKTGEVASQGAWTIAVRATAIRHGFANVPCAEFMSEMIRQAYARAGLKAADDFGDSLIWHKSASVERLGRALAQAGWGVWDAQQFKPPTGAILMHESGRSPGHTYMAAGDDGRFIIDNGAPQGRDLRRTVERTLGLMYQTGVFFLPPGIEPQRWL